MSGAPFDSIACCYPGSLAGTSLIPRRSSPKVEKCVIVAHLYPLPFFGICSYPLSLATGDFNGDGALDVAVATQSSTAIPVFYNQGGTRSADGGAPGRRNWLLANPCR